MLWRLGYGSHSVYLCCWSLHQYCCITGRMCVVKKMVLLASADLLTGLRTRTRIVCLCLCYHSR